MNKFLIKPLQKYLDERSDSIQSDIDNANSSKEEASVLLSQQKELLKEARVEAKYIREKTEIASKKEHEDMISKTKEESQRLIAQAKKEIDLNVARVKKEMVSEAGELVIQLSEKVLSKKLQGTSLR